MRQILFIILLSLLTGSLGETAAVKRELRGGRGGGSFSSSRGGSYSRSGYYRSSKITYNSKGGGSYSKLSSSYKVTNGKYAYSSYKNTPIRTNDYWNPKTSRTY